MRAIIYTRSRSSTGHDAERQLEQRRTLAASGGWDVTAVFTRTTASAYRLDRPGPNAATQQVRHRECDVLVTSDISRLTRSASVSASIVSDADASGAAVVTADGAVDTSIFEGRFTARIIGAVNDASAGR